jgi:hypothetical protein
LLVDPILRAALKTFIIVAVFALTLVARIRNASTALITGTVASETWKKMTLVCEVSLIILLEELAIL